MSRWACGRARSTTRGATTRLAEYVQIMRALWQTGHCDFKGDFFRMDDCRLLPMPQAPIRIICAGQSEGRHALHRPTRRRQFLPGRRASTRPRRIAATTARLAVEVAAAGREVGACILFMVIADETDEAAMAKWQRYCDGIDQRGRRLDDRPGRWPTRNAPATSVSAQEGAARAADQPQHGNPGRLLRSIARMLDEAADVPGTTGVMLMLRRLRRRHGSLRHPHPAAHALAPRGPRQSRRGMTSLTLPVIDVSPLSAAAPASRLEVGEQIGRSYGAISVGAGVTT